MDFESILNAACKNNKKNSKTLNELDSEVSKEKTQKLKAIEAEKKSKLEEARKRRLARPVIPEKKFVIPKKKVENGVDQNKLKAFLAKKEEEKQVDEKKKQAEKERLIQLRLQSHGGKANKKLGKQFGMDPIDLQIRYGNDHSLVEQLQKQKWREEDEQDKLSSHYRDGVYKAIAQKRKVQEKMKTSTHQGNRQPHRVSTSKANSLAGLSSRHAASRDHFSPPPEQKKAISKPSVQSAIPKKRPAPPVDFQTLMKTAEQISKGHDISVDRFNMASNSQKLKQGSSSDIRPSSSYNSESNYQKEKLSGSRRFSNEKASDSRGKSTSHVKEISKRKEDEIVSKKQNNVPAVSSKPGQRYLPGDIRYNPQGDVSSVIRKQEPSASSSRMKQDIRSEKTKMKNESHKDCSNIRRSSHPSRQSDTKSIQKKRHYDMPRSLLERERARERSRYDTEEYYDDNEEYDSEMDDFIDDTELDEMNREEFEDTLKMVNPKYNKNKWKERERMIDVRYMDADYRTVSKEEARSSKIGIMEDYLEAKKGKSHAI